MPGEFITKFTIWLALSGYVIAVVTLLLSRNRDSLARWAWTVGCISLLVHVACAYNYYHSWSYTSSFKETAKQTAEVYGIYWGGGLFVNYFLMLGWTADVIWWWTGLEKYRKRSKAITISWHIFLFFIFFNATVVFASGSLRWIGILISIIILWFALRSFVTSRFMRSSNEVTQF
jgi:hypothetical protein